MFLSCRAMSLVRVMQVITEPIAITEIANLSMLSEPRSDISMLLNIQAAVRVAMRCCFAMGPLKLCGKPKAPPKTRTYAVNAADSAANHPTAANSEAYPAAINKSESAIRSGNSLYSWPSDDFLAPSIATMPSNKLQTRRPWIDKAAKIKFIAVWGQRSSTEPTTEKKILATEI